MTDLSYALEALRSDAAVWDDASDALSQAKYSAVPMVTACDFTTHGESAYQTYERLCQLVSDLLAEGAQETSRMADALLKVRQDFESNEEQARESFTGVWEPRR